MPQSRLNHAPRSAPALERIAVVGAVEAPRRVLHRGCDVAVSLILGIIADVGVDDLARRVEVAGAVEPLDPAADYGRGVRAVPFLVGLGRELAALLPLAGLAPGVLAERHDHAALMLVLVRVEPDGDRLLVDQRQVERHALDDAGGSLLWLDLLGGE